MTFVTSLLRFGNSGQSDFLGVCEPPALAQRPYLIAVAFPRTFIRANARGCQDTNDKDVTRPLQSAIHRPSPGRKKRRALTDPRLRNLQYPCLTNAIEQAAFL